MMPEISLNILDVAENSVRAKASLIEITVSVKPKEDTLSVIIRDDGRSGKTCAGSVFYYKDD